MKSKKDVIPGTVLGDMHDSHLNGFWSGLIEGYVLSDLIKQSVTTERAEQFLALFLGIIEDEVPFYQIGLFRYTNKELVVFGEGTDGSVKAFWVYDGCVVGVAKLKPEKEEV